jgi:acyl-coenzyme A synthetase/AMP-(fatty) acid ligase/thioesterase domain-containing protein
MPNSFAADAWLAADFAALLRQLRDADPAAPMVADGEGGTLDRAGFWRIACGVSQAAAAEPPGIFGLLPPHGAAGQAWLLGAFLAGRPFAVFDPRDPPGRLAEISDALGLAAILAGPGTTPPAGFRGAGEVAEAAEPATWHSDPDAPAIIVPTSGSTGRPKGIVLARRAFALRSHQVAGEFGYGPGSVFLSPAASGSMAGIMHAFSCLFAGGLLVRVDTSRIGLTGALRAAEAAGGATALQGVPAMLCALLAVPGAAAAFAGVRRCQASGATLLATDLQALRAALPASCTLVNVYGLTEAPAILRWDVPDGWRPDGPRVPGGQPLAGVHVAILDEDGQAVPDGEAGELVARGVTMALGEWRDGGLAPSPRIAEAGGGERIVRTGDIARRRSDGLIEIVGRADRQVKIGGRRVEMEEIEDRLRRAEGVAEAVVLADREAPGGPRLYAAVAARPDAPAGLAERLRADLRAALPGYMQPARLEAWEALPRLPGGKVDGLAVLARLRAAGSAAPAAADPAVEQAWRRVLGQPPAEGVSFRAAGGDSLGFLNLVLEIERRTGREGLLARLEPEMNATELSAALAAPARLASGPRVLIVPGLHGDFGGGLARLAEACPGLDLRIAPLQAWPALARAGGEVEDDAAALLPLARSLFPPGVPALLAGYSYGGAVAHALARLLLATGQPVGGLLLLDPGPTPAAAAAGGGAAPAGSERAAGAGWATMPGTTWAALRWRFQWLGRDPRRARLAARVMPGTAPRARHAVTLWSDVQLGLRLRALRRWGQRAQPLDGVPALLFATAPHGEGTPAAAEWAARSALRGIVPIGGDHATMIMPPHRDGLAAALTRAVLELAPGG